MKEQIYKGIADKESGLELGVITKSLRAILVSIEFSGVRNMVCGYTLQN